MSENNVLPENLTFEQANAMLDETVEKLGDNSISLDRSLELYALACELLSFCVRELELYKGKINELHSEMISSLRKDNGDDN